MLDAPLDVGLWKLRPRAADNETGTLSKKTWRLDAFKRLFDGSLCGLVRTDAESIWCLQRRLHHRVGAFTVFWRLQTETLFAKDFIRSAAIFGDNQL